MRYPQKSTLFPYTTLFRSGAAGTGYRGRRKNPYICGYGGGFTGSGRSRGGTEPERPADRCFPLLRARRARSEEHTSELQSRPHLVCRLLLEKKKNRINISH